MISSYKIIYRYINLAPKVKHNTMSNTKEAKLKAREMNKDLVVVGEYFMSEKLLFVDELGAL